MKRLVYIWLVAWVLWGCQKEEAYFDVLVPADGLTFSPVEGGAVMHYRLPADEKVYSIPVVMPAIHCLSQVLMRRGKG